MNINSNRKSKNRYNHASMSNMGQLTNNTFLSAVSQASSSNSGRQSPYGSQTVELFTQAGLEFDEEIDKKCSDAQSCSLEQNALSSVSSIVLPSQAPAPAPAQAPAQQPVVAAAQIDQEKLKNIKTGIVVISAAVTGAAIYYIGPFALKISKSVLDKLVELGSATTGVGLAAITGATNDLTHFYQWAIQESPITQFFFNALMNSLRLGKDVIYQLLIPLGKVLLQYAQSGIMNVMTLTTTLISTMIDVIITIIEGQSTQIRQSLVAFIMNVLLPLYTISQFQFKRHMHELLQDDNIRVTRSGYVRQNFGNVGSSESVAEILNEKIRKLKVKIIKLTDDTKVGITASVVTTKNTLKYGKNQTKSGIKKTLRNINLAIRTTKNIYKDVKELSGKSVNDLLIMVDRFKERGTQFRDDCIAKINTVKTRLDTYADGFEARLRGDPSAVSYDEDVAYVLEKVGALTNVIAAQGQSMISRVGIYQTLMTMATIASYARQTGPIISGRKRTIKRRNKKKKKVSMRKRKRSLRIKKKRKKGSRRKN